MFTNAKNPKWTGANHQTIMLEVEMGGEWVIFVAAPTDCTDHGPMLYHFAVKGLFGEIAASDEELILAGKMDPPEGYEVQGGRIVKIPDYEQLATAELNRRLALVNTEENKARAAVDEEYAEEFKTSLLALLAVRDQPGWPRDIGWPPETE